MIQGMKTRFYSFRALPNPLAGSDMPTLKGKAGRLALAVSALSLVLQAAPGYCDAPLQGNVQETGAVENQTFQPAVPMLAPVVKEKKKKLEGEAQGSGLSGQAQDQNDGLNRGQAQEDQLDGPMKGQLQEQGGVLKGSASAQDTDLQAQDPDTADQELMVEWDKWHNRLLWSIQSGVQELINSPENVEPRWDAKRGRVVVGPNIPLGTKATFFVRVSNDKRIVKARIVQPSGYPDYDKALLDAIYALDGTSILRFPRNSKRQRVNETATIITSDRGDREFFKFGDVEKYTVPGR